MDFENGVIVKIYKFLVDLISAWGRLRRPQTKMGISSGPITLKFWQSHHFQNCDFENGNFFLVQSAAQKWSSLQKMIVLTHQSFWQEISNFHFSPENDPKGGLLDDFLPSKVGLLPSSVQFQLASSVKLRLALILIVTLTHPPPGNH